MVAPGRSRRSRHCPSSIVTIETASTASPKPLGPVGGGRRGAEDAGQILSLRYQTLCGSTRCWSVGSGPNPCWVVASHHLLITWRGSCCQDEILSTSAWHISKSPHLPTVLLSQLLLNYLPLPSMDPIYSLLSADSNSELLITQRNNYYRHSKNCFSSVKI